MRSDPDAWAEATGSGCGCHITATGLPDEGIGLTNKWGIRIVGSGGGKSYRQLWTGTGVPAEEVADSFAQKHQCPTA